MLLALSVQMVFAQQKTVSGTVSDENGLPLPGATVIRAGTSSGTSTDFDGKYQLSANVGDVLEISYVGYATQSVTVGASNTYDVSMALDNTLEEVVVTGVATGTSTKKLGFKVEKVGIEGLKTIPTPDVASALTGKVAGAQIVRGSGNPIRSSAIILRGASTIEGSSEPLIIIDGIITQGNLNDVNMDDVESIEVVKGAAASSLYGSQAGNGVIQIITKKGRSDKPQFVFKAETGFSEVNGTYPLAKNHDRLLDSSGEFDISSGSIVPDPDGIFNNPWPGQIKDNVGEFISSQPYSSLNLSLAQRLDKINYFTSLQEVTVDGILDGLNPYKRQSARLNLDIDVTNKLKLKLNSNLVKTKGSEVEQQGQGDNLFFNLLTAVPTDDLTQKDANGNFIPFFPGNGYVNEYQNPLYLANTVKNDREDRRFIGGITASYTFTDEFSLTTNISLDRNSFYYRNLFPKGFDTGSQPNANLDDGFIFVRNRFTNRVNSSVQLNYQKQFGDINLRSSFRYLFENIDDELFDSSSSTFQTEGVETLGQGTTNISVGSALFKEKTQNFFLTADVDWKDKIILGGLIRTDRSSLFGVNNRDQIFYRGSLAYRLGEDLDNDWIDELKLRASYGTAGLRPLFGDIFETFSVSQAGISPFQVGNPDLRSPEIGEFETGIDFNFLGKYRFSFTYAKSKTKDALITVPLSGAIPGSRQVQNVGETEYTSYEVALSGTPISNDNFTWDFGITASTTENKYGSLGGVAPFNRIFLATLFDPAPALNIFRVEEGQPYGSIYGNSLAKSISDLTVVDGLVINEGLNLPVSDFSVNEYGHVIVTAHKDISGAIGTGEQAIRIWDEDSNQAISKNIGDTNPDLIMGLSNTFSYKNLSFYMLWDMQFGGNVYNYTKQLLYFNDRHGELDDFGAAGQPHTYVNSTSNIYNRGQAIDYFVEDATFAKLREISLSYTLSKSVLKNTPLESLRLTLSGRNLITITNYTGWDPEISTEDSAIFKLDEFSYPNFRTYVASIQITF